MKISAQDQYALGARHFARALIGYAAAALVMGFFASAPVRAQLVITTSGSAPSTGVFVSQPVEDPLSDSGLLLQTGTGSYFGFGQVFTAPSTVTLKSVSVRLDSSGADNTPTVLSEWSGQSLTFGVFSTASAASTTLGSNLFSATAALPTLMVGDYVTFNFPSGVSLTAGSSYGFAIIPAAVVGADSLFIASSNANLYAAGRRLVFDSASFTETGSNASNDTVFFLSTSAIPEPSTDGVILGLLALGVVAGYRVRCRHRAA